MNCKVTAIFLCALLCSGFAHEWYNSKLSLEQHSMLGRARALKLSEDLRPYTNKELASLVSTDPVYYCTNSNGNVIGITNSHQNRALIIDLSVNIALIVNGGTGAAVVVNLQTNVAKQILLGVWLSATTSIQSFISTVNCQQLFNNAILTVNISAPSLTVSNLVQSVLSTLDVGLGLQLQVSNTLGLQLAISICANIRANLITNINANILVRVSTSLVQCKGGLSALQAIIQAIANLQVKLNVTTIVSASIKLSLVSILNAQDGLAAFVYICNTLAVSLNLTSVISQDLWSSEEALLNICIGLGGNIDVGVTGVLKVIVNVLALIDVTITLDVLLQIIIKVCANITATINISTSLTSLKTCLDNQVTLHNTAALLSVPISLVESLLDNTLVRGNINISAIVTLLCGGLSTTSLNIIVKVCALLSTNISLGISVQLLYTTLLRVLIQLLKTVTGRASLQIIIPGLLNGLSMLLQCLNILVGLTLSEVLNILNSQGLITALTSITVTRNIYQACNTSITAIANLNLDTCVNAASAASEKANIIVLVQSADSLC